MTAKERLHNLVEELSEHEAEGALPLLSIWRTDRMRAVLDAAPEVDEPLTEAEAVSLDEADAA